MRKIIWAIGIVLCVQVAFQLAMTVDRSDADYAALETPLQNGIDNVRALPVSDLDTNIAPVDLETTTEASPLATRVLVRYVPIYTERPAAAKHRSPTPFSPFKPVVITYDRTGALTTGVAKNTLERREPTTSEPRKVDKRSLVAKTIAKPYDWIKAVGSKLH